MRIARAAALLALATLTGVASAQSARVLTRGEVKPVILPQPLPTQRYIEPIWSGRALLIAIVSESREPVISAVTADGLAEEVRFSMPDWGTLGLVSLWGGDDGEIVAAGTGANEHFEPQGFVVRIGPDRSKRTYIPVENLSIRAMTVGPSGVIWALGSGKDQETGILHSNILTRLSPTGKVLSSTVLVFRGKPPYDVAGRTSMRASADRVAWLTARNDYVEFGTDGTEMTHIAGPSTGQPKSSANTLASMYNTAFALSAANTALISRPATARVSKDAKLNIWTLDRVKQDWFLSESAEGAFPQSTSIYGFNGDTLMTSGFDRQLGQLLVRYTLSETK